MLDEYKMKTTNCFKKRQFLLHPISKKKAMGITHGLNYSMSMGSESGLPVDSDDYLLMILRSRTDPLIK